MYRTVLLGAIVALSVIGSTAAQAPLPDLAGVYRCDGKNPDGSAYQGVVEISKVRDTFRVRWTMDDGAIMGVGIYSGGVLAVSYFGGAPAVVVYKVDGKDGNKLVGEWTMGGAEGEMYVETLIKTPGLQAPARPIPSAPPRPRRQTPTSPENGGGLQL